MIAPGERLALDFDVKVARDGRGETVRFRDLLTRPTIVSVYMRNNTGSCDRQIASLAAAAGEFASLGFDVVAISRDTVGSHLRYADTHGVRFPLVSDPDDLFSTAAGAIVAKSMYGRTFHGPARAAYVVDRDGVVLAVIAKVDTKDHAAQLHAVLASMKR